MKKIILLLVILNLVQNINVNGQTSNWQWARQATGTDFTANGSIATDAAGNVYVTGLMDTSVTFGTIHLTRHPGGPFFLVKYDSLGTVIWACNPGGTARAATSSVTTDAAGNVYVTGTYHGVTAITYTLIFGTTTLTCTGYQNNMFLVKYDASGNALWATSTANNVVNTRSVATDAVGNVFVTGDFDSPGTLVFGTTTLTSTAAFTSFLVKYDASGNVMWAVQGVGNSAASSVATDAWNNIYITGYFYNSTVTFDTITLTLTPGCTHSNVFTVKYNEAGAALWAKMFGGIDNEYSSSIATDASGNVYVTGAFTNTVPIVFGSSSISTPLPSSSTEYMYLLKYTTNGIEQWATEAGVASHSARGWSVSTDASGVFVSGDFNNPTIIFGTDTLLFGTSVYFPLFLVKYDFSGNVLCASHLDADNSNAVATDAFGNAYVTGGFTANPFIAGTDTLHTLTNSFFVAKYNCLTSHESVNEITNEKTIELFPNPTTGELRITNYELRITEVSIYNVLGEELLSTTLTNNQSTINISQFSKGIYFVEIKTEKGVVMKKVVKDGN